MKKLLMFAVCAASILMATSCSKKSTISQGTTGMSEHTVVDHAGNTVTIPANPQRIVFGSLLPLPSIYCIYAGSAKKVVGMPPSSMAAAKESLLAEAYPEILNVSTEFVQKNIISIETLMELNPDLILYNSGNKEEKELYEKAGIPAVGFSVGIADYNTIETYAAWIELLEQVFGETSRSKELIDYGRNIEKTVKARVANLNETEKPRGMVIYSYANGNITSYGQKMFPQYWLTTVGGVNVAQEKIGVIQLNMEQIYEWDPEVLLLTNFNPKLPDDFYNGLVDDDDWSSVKAVKNHKVYKFPLGMYRWCPPSSDTPLALQWIATKLHPELFADFDMNVITKDYFKRFYNIELTDAQLEKIYNSSREASGVN